MQMFRSATLKLTLWYLAILMAISLTFSMVIYQLNLREINFRLENLQHSLLETVFNTGFKIVTTGPESPLVVQGSEAASQMALSLLYLNIVVLLAGGLGSYFLARRTLRPIEEAHEAQSRFTSDASHELRTPLSAMKTELEVTLRDPNLSAEEARELLQSNLEEVNKLIDVSELLLKLSRLDYDKLERTPVDVVKMCKESLKQHPKDRRRFKITSRKTAFVYANKPAVLELLGILIENSLKYSPAKSPISIRIFIRRGMVAFEITNQGEPIPLERQQKLFDRFYRADTSRTESSKNGYGLGLSIARKIVEIHHGDISVTSTKAGTKFTACLPVLRRQKA